MDVLNGNGIEIAAYQGLLRSGYKKVSEAI